MYAEQYMTRTHNSIIKQYQELRVFRNEPSAAFVAGVVQIEPHTTFRDLRVVLQVREHWVYDAAVLDCMGYVPMSASTQAELGFECESGEDFVLSRTDYPDGEATKCDTTENDRADASAWRRLICPIFLTQNHKLVAPLFPWASDVLVVRRSGWDMVSDLRADVERRALPGQSRPSQIPDRCKPTLSALCR